MAKFSSIDIDKHDFGYVKKVLDDIEAGKAIKINDVATVLPKEDKRFDEIRKLINANQSPAAYIKLNFKEWTKIDKSQYTKIKGAGRSISVTDESEQAVIIWLDIILEEGLAVDYEPVFLSYLDNYAPKRAVLSSSDVSKTSAWLAKNSDWSYATFQSARCIYSQFGNKLTSYKFHQNTPEFNHIRKCGAVLSKLTADKWNPSDVYLIKTGFNVYTLNNIKSIHELNSTIGGHSNIIGVSLKKSDLEANHGKAALNNISKVKSHISQVKNVSNIVSGDQLTKQGIDLISKSTKIVFRLLNGKLKIITRREDGANLINQLPTAKIKSDSYSKSLPAILNWIADHRDHRDLLESISLLVCIALSRNPLACAHWKSYGADSRIVEVVGTPEINIECMRLKLSGDIDVIFDINVDGHDYKAQIRSFGSMPQLELKKKDSTANWITATI